MAITVPNLGSFISLVGALCITALAIVFPAVIELCVYWDDGKIHPWVLTRNVLILVFGLFGLVTGTYVSIAGMIEAFQKQ